MGSQGGSQGGSQRGSQRGRSMHSGGLLAHHGMIRRGSAPFSCTAPSSPNYEVGSPLPVGPEIHEGTAGVAAPQLLGARPHHCKQGVRHRGQARRSVPRQRWTVARAAPQDGSSPARPARSPSICSQTLGQQPPIACETQASGSSHVRTIHPDAAKTAADQLAFPRRPSQAYAV